MNGGWLAHVHAVWGTQVVRMIQGPAEVEGFEAAVEDLRPGGTFRKFFAAHPRVVLQGIGAGDDGPVLTAESSSDLLDMPIEPDTAFTLTVGAYARPVVIGDHQAMSF